MNHHRLNCRIVEYALDTQNLNLSAIRTIRVLRPLRAINRIPSEYRIGINRIPSEYRINPVTSG
jgi:hypothetical protein